MDRPWSQRNSGASGVERKKGVCILAHNGDEAEAKEGREEARRDGALGEAIESRMVERKMRRWPQSGVEGKEAADMPRHGGAGTVERWGTAWAATNTPAGPKSPADRAAADLPAGCQPCSFLSLAARGVLAIFACRHRPQPHPSKPQWKSLDHRESQTQYRKLSA